MIKHLLVRENYNNRTLLYDVQGVIAICHPYITDILRYTYFAKIFPKSCKGLHNHSSFSRNICFVC